MKRVITHDFHGRFSMFFKKMKNVEVVFVSKDEIVKCSEQYDYAVVSEMSLLDYQKINCKKILIDVCYAGRFTDLLNYAIYDHDTTAIVFATYKQHIDFKFKNCKKVRVINWAIDVNEWPVWNGGVDGILGVCNMISRSICGEEIWTQTTHSLPRVQLGFGNSHLTENVGSKTDVELKDYYKNYNVFFHHATLSPAPNVLLEAMAVGIPIVAYDSWFAQEHLNYRGVISNNIDKLRTKLSQLVYKPEQCFIDYGMLNREYVKANFNPELFYYKWQQLLK